jgi:hypothetical protein
MRYKSLKKEIREDSWRWNDLPHSQTGRINIMKMGIPSKAIYMFNAILHRGRKINLKVNTQAQKNSQSNSD